LGGNSLSDLLVFGRRAGLHAAEYAKSIKASPAISDDQVEQVARELLSPFEGEGGENPYAIHSALQECMQNLVGIIRTEKELKQALDEIQVFKQRVKKVRVEGNRHFNPGWHLALDLRSMLSVAEATTMGALERKESRGGHTRDDYPDTDPYYAKVNLVLRKRNGEWTLTPEPLPEMPDELKALFEEKK
jgi:succinate dehydrogenase / fumarate reductase flavoprotein subunit